EDESGREDAVRAEPGAGEASPVETVRPKAFGTGYELWVGLAVGFYVVYSAADLISGLVDSRLRLPLDFESEAVSTLDLPQSSAPRASRWSGSRRSCSFSPSSGRGSQSCRSSGTSPRGRRSRLERSGRWGSSSGSWPSEPSSTSRR